MTAQRIFKYSLPVTTGVVVVEMPRRATLLFFAEDPQGALCVWAQVDPTHETVGHAVHIAFTGDHLPSGSYVGSCVLRKEPIVVHLYDLGEAP